ncbi:MAG: hypothetical protein HZT40_09255 [Candidatus Thiothrix singaporensis]|uniref:Condensation domain-containing protein n=1 Tax=Candidatus Thiothrix singaporensis TaxID=2799669 RepID=A0A7L6AZ60_9GAMM|nr:MAG: hypothetical protein HZT40_09255 [Candidatus Thiothrix singaporensis]
MSPAISPSLSASKALDAPALEQTLNAIIQRHEVFRVRCETVGNRPLQSAAQGIRFELPVHDLSKLPSQDKEATVAIHAERHALEPFNLSHAPLLRAELLKTAADEHIFLLATHQYVFDGWSTAILFRELSTLYTAFRAGEASPLPPPSAQYADFAHWLRHGFAGAEAARQEAYWQEKLRDAQLVTALPLDHPRQANVPNRSASVAFTLPSFLADALRKLSQQVGVTLFISLLAAFQTLLYGYTRQEKLAVGSIVSNRQLTQTETMIGSFANNILISSDFFPA